MHSQQEYSNLRALRAAVRGAAVGVARGRRTAALVEQLQGKLLPQALRRLEPWERRSSGSTARRARCARRCARSRRAGAAGRRRGAEEAADVSSKRSTLC